MYDLEGEVQFLRVRFPLDPLFSDLSSCVLMLTERMKRVARKSTKADSERAKNKMGTHANKEPKNGPTK